MKMFSRLKITKRITAVFMLFPAGVTIVAMLMSILSSGNIISTTVASCRKFGRQTTENVGSMILKNCRREFMSLTRLQALNTYTRVASLDRDIDAISSMLQSAAENELNFTNNISLRYNDFFSHFSFGQGVDPQKELTTIYKLSSMRGVFMNLYAKNDSVRLSGFVSSGGVCFRYPWCFFSKGFAPRLTKWYTDAVKAKGTTVWSGPFDISGNGYLVLSASRAVFNSRGGMLGVVFVFLDADQVVSDIMTIRGINGTLAIVDGNGRVMAREKSGVRHFETGDKSNEKIPVVLQNSIRTRTPEIVEYKDNGIEYMTAVAPIQSTNWSIVISVSRQNIIAPVMDTEKNIEKKVALAQNSVMGLIHTQAIIYLGVGAVALLIMSLVAVRLSRRITRPLELLRAGALTIGEGNLESSIEIKTGDELEDLAGTFNNMTVSLRENIAGIKSNLEAEERLKQDLKIAADIQRSLLPNRFPAFPDRREFDLYALMQPALEVGGDFYDFCFVSDDKLYFCVADVSGKGISAAMFMARTRMLMRFEATGGAAPDEMLLNVNNELEKTNSACMFATVFCAVLDVASGDLQYASAGHNPPLLRRHDGDYEYLAIHRALAVGPMVQKTGIYQIQQLKMMPGDQLFVYTDGIVEAENDEAQQYGEERLRDDLNLDREEWPQRLTDNILEKVVKFVDGAPQSDDITILTIKYTGSEKS
jgi:phosphoserine phosphatase RsbU/P